MSICWREAWFYVFVSTYARFRIILTHISWTEWHNTASDLIEAQTGYSFKNKSCLLCDFDSGTEDLWCNMSTRSRFYLVQFDFRLQCHEGFMNAKKGTFHPRTNGCIPGRICNFALHRDGSYDITIYRAIKALPVISNPVQYTPDLIRASGF